MNHEDGVPAQPHRIYGRQGKQDIEACRQARLLFVKGLMSKGWVTSVRSAPRLTQKLGRWMSGGSGHDQNES
ncbi:MAG: hypothetical protein VXZ15_10505, partial [Planctomycetota bacterium]|nr:hypothetical protein [Planctomycetota bacterium]